MVNPRDEIIAIRLAAIGESPVDNAELGWEVQLGLLFKELVRGRIQPLCCYRARDQRRAAQQSKVRKGFTYKEAGFEDWVCTAQVLVIRAYDSRLGEGFAICQLGQG